MTNKEILKKYLEKAIANGYDDNENDYYESLLIDGENFVGFEYACIFDKKIAKAFWGERRECKCSGFCIQYQGCSCGSIQSGWQFHLQQLVLEEEPLKYIAKFLDNEE